jgi:hypothetical protein
MSYKPLFASKLYIHATSHRNGTKAGHRPLEPEIMLGKKAKNGDGP